MLHLISVSVFLSLEGTREYYKLAESAWKIKKHCRIVRFSNENAMMHGLDGLLISLIYNNATRVDFLITYLLLFFVYTCSHKKCMIKQ